MSDSKKPNDKTSRQPDLGLLLGLALFGASQFVHNKTFIDVSKYISFAIVIPLLALSFMRRIKKRRLEAKMSQDRKF